MEGAVPNIYTVMRRFSVKELSRGVMIVFEGIDGSGKTTQILKVAESLKEHSYEVTVTHEPNHNSKWGQLIQNKVKRHREEVTPETELEWYLKDRKWDLETNILPALEKNHIVLVDRYYLSSAAYQGALKTFTPEYVLQRNSFAQKPDLWIILDVPVPLGQKRLRIRDKKDTKDQLEKAEYQEEVRQNYLKLAKMDIGGKIEWVDASGTEKELTETLTTIILKFLRDFQTH
ncbi:MAG: dTMP kinase [Candidatus Heimdallarchaeota archaeon]|nr:MAG: dTMP kinase [Candidatus Heimdallarchaeota archaeon]